MAAPYAALVSLIHVLNRIQHPSCPAFFDPSKIQSLFDKVSFLIDFLEKNEKIKFTQILERKIVDAAHEAEDLIESYVVDQIRQQKTYYRNYIILCEDLQKVTQRFDVTIGNIIKIKDGRSEEDDLSRVSKPIALPVSDHSRMDTMVGFDEDLKSLMNQLTSHDSTRRIISIVGMGGIGKTTLTRNTYNDPFIVQQFITRAWVTVSQDSNVKEIFRCLLREVGIHDDAKKCNEELGDQLHKYLYCRKYLIVLDDIWSNEVLDMVLRFLPENNNQSRIVLSTRLLGVAVKVGSCNTHTMKFLNDNKSWDLLSKTIFGEKTCPRELELVGKRIARSCKGLPLTIVVTGGLLKRLQRTPREWESIAKNVNFHINTDDDDENCLNILSLSYNHLPIHLKPCFLYLANFPKNFKIPITELILLWVADGFLKPTLKKTLEEVTLEYLNDLIDRNLIMAGKRGSSGNVKQCIVHDSVMDLCIREAQKARFICMIKENPKEIESERRFVIHTAGYTGHHVLPSKPLARSFVSDSSKSPQLGSNCRLLRVFNSYCEDSLKTIFGLLNARFLLANTFDSEDSLIGSIPPSISLLWNLETLIVKGPKWGKSRILPLEIWELQNLKHLVFTGKVILPDPVGAQIDCVLNNLQTLSTVVNLNVTEDLVKKIPNLKKLEMYYDINQEVSEHVEVSTCFDNLAHLENLETLKCTFKPTEKNCVFNDLDALTLSPSLKNLTLSGSNIPWKNMSIVGSLPNLEVLKLKDNAFCGQEWNLTEEEFKKLKYLSIERCFLVTWDAESCNFPCLERLTLNELQLEEIPMSMSEIMTLEIIDMGFCQNSANISAKKFLDERQYCGNYDLTVFVTVPPSNYVPELRSLAGKDFRIDITTFSKKFTKQIWQDVESHTALRRSKDEIGGQVASEEKPILHHAVHQSVNRLLQGTDFVELANYVAERLWRTNLNLEHLNKPGEGVDEARGQHAEPNTSPNYESTKSD